MDAPVPAPSTATPAESLPVNVEPPLATDSNTTAPALQRHSFQFSGTTDEYFRIWIVNLTLTILTLGIYSAWAKVRTQRYFHANTSVAGSHFDYLADPIAILKGRLIGLALFGGYAIATRFSVVAALAVLVLIFALTPFLIVSAMRFRLRNIAWRNIQFAFDGRYGEAAKLYLLLPLLLIPTLGLAWPYVQYRQRKFLVEQARFGGTRFQPAFESGEFFSMFFATLGLSFAVFLGAGIFGSLLAFIWQPLLFVALVPAYLFVFVYYPSRLQIYVLNNSQLGEHRLQCTMTVSELYLLQLTNLVAVACTLGFAYPWSRIRVARYRAECMAILTRGSLDEFAAEAAASSNAVGQETGEFFDLDIGL